MWQLLASLTASTEASLFRKAIKTYGSTLEIRPAPAQPTEQLGNEDPNKEVLNRDITTPEKDKSDPAKDVVDQVNRLHEKGVGTIDQENIIQSSAEETETTEATALGGLTIAYESDGYYRIFHDGEFVTEGQYDQALTEAYNAMPKDQREKDLAQDLSAWRDRLLEKAGVEG